MRRAICILWVALPLAPGLKAELPDCRAGSDGYKVFLDDVFPASATAVDPATQTLMNRLRAKLKTDFLALQATSSLRPAVVPCDGRRPNNETDFGPDLVNAMNSRNVLLEVWGIVESGGPGADSRQASIGFVLIPVRKSRDLPGIYLLQFETATTGGDRLLQLIGGAPETKAFFDISTGVKAFKERRYEEAYDCLCRATATVAQLRTEGLGANRDVLTRYAGRLAADTLREANQDVTYQGRLRLADPARICK